MLRLLRWFRPPPSPRRATRGWCRITPSLLVGPVLDRDSYLELMQQGVTHVLDLRAEGNDDPDPAQLTGLNWLGIPVVDRYPPTDAQLEEAARWLDAANPGAVAYIHCQGGIERSPTLVVALLIRAGYEPSDARAAVLAGHPGARPTPAQEAWLTHVAASSMRPFPSD